jgi:hypothetical protein
VLFGATWEPLRTTRHDSTATVQARVSLTQTMPDGTDFKPRRVALPVDVHRRRRAGLAGLRDQRPLGRGDRHGRPEPFDCQRIAVAEPDVRLRPAR